MNVANLCCMFGFIMLKWKISSKQQQQQQRQQKRPPASQDLYDTHKSNQNKIKVPQTLRGFKILILS